MPLVVIGAPRSGTNLIRDLLASLPGYATWSCDEIDAVWRYRNLDLPDDSMRGAHARPEVIRYVRRRFARLARREGAQVVVEKTCANSLRVEFVRAVLPSARLLVILRSGKDVVPSAVKRWQSSTDWRYTWDKARHVPTRSIPGFAREFASRRSGDTDSWSWWGPRIPGWTDLLGLSLELRAAYQWAGCVESSASDLARTPPAHWAAICYEELVQEPRGTLRDALLKLGFPAPARDDLERATRIVSADRVGRGRIATADCAYEELGDRLAAGTRAAHRILGLRDNSDF